MRPVHGIGSLLLAGVVALSACERPAPDVARVDGPTVTDYTGRVVALEAPAQRVLSLMPSVTDLLLAMHAQEVLIARTRFDLDPRIAQLPTTGNALTPSIEWIAALRPDLVITWPDQPSHPVISRLNQLGIPTYAARTDRIADIDTIARDIGVLIGRETTGDSVARALDAAFDSIRVRVAGAPPIRVVYALSLDPPTVAGPGTFLHELIELAGGSNSFGDVRAQWPQVSIEEVIQRNPDAIVVAGEESTIAAARIRELPGWRELEAVRNNRVLMVDPYVFNRLGPATTRAAAELARFLHPDRFAGER